MSESGIRTAARDKIVLAVVSHWNEGQLDDALALFADRFTFKDHGVGLEFNTKDRLAEFFKKARELYPDMFLQSETLFVSDDHAITEWTLQTTLTEPFFGNLTRKVPISLRGASVGLTQNGRIKRWSDYYDELVARRTALASHFPEWIEY